VSGIQQLLLGGAPSGGYQIERSLRFNSADSAYLSRTPAVNGNRKTWTFSFWVKRGTLGTTQNFFDSSNGAGTVRCFLRFNTSNQIYGQLNAGTASITTTPVYRDVSAWYHILWYCDTTQLTAANRMKLYVNGVQVTDGTFNYPTPQNSDQELNIGSQAFNIGRYVNGGENYDGYLTEINFIDGYAYDPSYFGQTDSATGVWGPKEYTGTYGTNGFYLPMSAGTTFSGFFDGSNDYLEIANNAAWQYGTGDFTVECWLFGTSSSSFSNQYIIGRYNNSLSSHSMLQISSTTDVYWYYGNGLAYLFTYSTGFITNTWYHLAVSRSGTSLRFFVNGTQVGATQTNSTNYGGTSTFRISNGHQTSATYFPGYISNARVVKGTAVYTANFTPSTTPLTAITNTVLLTCQSSTFIDNSTNNFAITNNGGAITQLFSPFYFDATDDQSGNGNNWQPNNLDLTTTGVGADSLVDTPTSYGTDTGAGGEVRGNYATMNPLDAQGTATLTNGNLTIASSTTNHRNRKATFLMPTTGKWYFELTTASTCSASVILGWGLQTTAAATNAQAGSAGAWMAQNDANQDVWSETTQLVSAGSAVAGNSIRQLAYDADTGKLWFGVNNTWYSSTDLTSGNPSTGANPCITLSAGSYFPAVSCYNITADVNFGQRAFSYTAPYGFKALCTQNLETPTIGATSTTQANKFFDVNTYNGQSTSLTLTNSGSMQPDFVWIKCRNSTDSHNLTDAVRGTNKNLSSNTTDQEDTVARLTSFNSNGITLAGGFGITNNSTQTYVAWQWNAGGSNQTISVGQYSTSPNVPSIASTVRANTTAGFSIVTWTGNGASSATIGHGCQVGGIPTAPSMIIVKNRSASWGWFVYNKYLPNPNTGRLQLNLPNGEIPGGTPGPWNNTAPTSTVFSLGNNTFPEVNGSGNLILAYCFAEVAGYSAFGSYTGNGVPDGPFVFTGFRPAFVLTKRTDSSSNWYLWDNKRIISSNGDAGLLNPEAPNIEGDYNAAGIDLLSNGFKIRNSDASDNASGGGFIFMAFAENPFKYSLAR